MKCLSLIQPWATLLCMGIKTVETRSWPTTHRGLLYIHASKTYSTEGQKLWGEKWMQERLLNRFGSWEFVPSFEVLPRGAVIGSVSLEKCLLMTPELILKQHNLELSCGDWKIGRFAWFCSQPSEMSPIPAKGSLQLWDFDPNAPQPVPVVSQSQLFAIGKSAARRRRKRKGIIVEQDVILENDPILDRIQRKFEL